jgi:hypothetical protein
MFLINAEQCVHLRAKKCPYYPVSRHPSSRLEAALPVLPATGVLLNGWGMDVL